MKVWSTLLLTGYALVSMVGQAAASYSCNSPHNACESAKWADAIFIGKAVAISKSNGGGELSTGPTTFEVTEVFKGHPSQKVEVQSGDYVFQVGHEYLVFATQQGDIFRTSICSANEPIESAGEHLLYLRHLGPQLSGGQTLPGQVVGRVSNRAQDFKNSLFPLTWPSPGVPVRAWQNGIEARTTTSDSGWYHFFDLPPGHYQIAVDSPTRYQPVGNESVDVQPGSCPGVSFVNASRAVLKGWLFDDEGEPDESSDLRLVPADSPPPSAIPGIGNSELETDTHEDGSFRFEVPAGRYRLAIKPLGELTLVYYPVVLALEDSASSGSRETEIEFRLPKRPVQIVRGTVLDADGRPVEGAVVRFWGDTPDGSKSWGQGNSDSEGAFGFEGLPMEYEIVAEWPACERLISAKTLVTPGQTKPIVVLLALRGDRRCPKSP